MKKKLCSAVICASALVLSALSLSPMTASAKGYKDLTGDGKFDAADVQFMARFLRGNADYTKGPLSDLDADGNFVIDQIDALLYLEKYLEDIMMG